ncbi:VWA domain-containing protein [Salinibaculum sp. GCM10025337]|uniref:VWA domain-containing protein n=2 Tax=Salinibaculum TaxID=2732368 RepID=UPI003612E046
MWNDLTEDVQSRPFGLIPLLSTTDMCIRHEAQSGTLSLCDSTFDCSIRLSPLLSESNSVSDLISREIRVHRPQFEIILLIDLSSSMELPLTHSLSHSTQRDGLDESQPKKVELISDFVMQAIQGLQAHDKVAVATYNTSVDVLQELSEVKSLVRDDLEQKISAMEPSGGTDISTALSAGEEQFIDPDIAPKGIERRILLLTDTHPVLNTEIDSNISQTIERLADYGIFSTIGTLGVTIEQKSVADFKSVSGGELFEIS